MLQIIWGCDFSSWILERLPLVRTFGNHYVTMGIGDETRLLAAVVFYDYQPRFKSMQLSMASDSPKWCSKRTIREILSYAFNANDCERITAHTSSGNTRMIRLFHGLGFVEEGRMRKGFGTEDCLIFGLLKSEATRWL